MNIVYVKLTTKPSNSNILRIVRCFSVCIMDEAMRYRRFTRSIFVMVFINRFRGQFFSARARPCGDTTGRFIIPFTVNCRPQALSANGIEDHYRVCTSVYVIVRLRVEDKRDITRFIFRHFLSSVNFIVSPYRRVSFTNDRGDYRARHSKAKERVIRSRIIYDFDAQN